MKEMLLTFGDTLAKKRFFVLLDMLLLFVPAILWAQNPSVPVSDVNGIVVDDANHGVAGANLRLTAVLDTARVYQTVTNEEGGYSLRVQPGLYTMVVTAVGFKPFTAEVDAKKKVQVDVSMIDDVRQLNEVLVKGRRIRYDAEEWTDSNTCRYLKRLADPDCREQCVNALLYVSGKICSNDRSGKNMYHIWGPSNNGKSVLAAYLQAIVGSGNFGNLSLKDLTGQFTLINLRHALVNISTDEDTDAWNSSIASLIKRITGHDTLQVDVKYERMQQFKPYCVLLCMSNAEAKYSKELDAGAAISKRLFLIPTGPTVTEPDEDLLEKKLLPEKDLFFSVAMDYFMNNDHPVKIVDVEEIIFPEISPKELFACWHQDSVKVTEDSNELLTEDLWNNYCYYVQNVPGASRMKRRTFEMACAIKFSLNKSESRSHNRSCYIGLKLKNKVYRSIDTDADNDTDFGGW